ncbi:hypothetical protein QTP88_017606 [Uroleucon formosanum]
MKFAIIRSMTIGQKEYKQPRKYPRYYVYPLRLSDEEKVAHFDLLLMADDNGSHYTYITDFSRLLRAQKTGHKERVVFCKRFFTSFDDRLRKYKLSGQEVLGQHKLICGSHIPILPEMPKEGECAQFKAWRNTQRHSLVIYADFEAILVKTEEKRSESTTIIQKHEAMSYGVLVKASEDVPKGLLVQYEIPVGPVIYRSNENRTDVARHFVETIVEVVRKIEGLMKTNIPLFMTEGEEKTHQEFSVYIVCKCILAGG